MKRRLVVHIGANKTGSSSIQLFLWTNRNALRERGILVPGQKFAASSPQRATTAEFEALFNDPLGPGLFCDAIAALVEEEPGVHTVILTSENLAAHPAAPSLFRNLAQHFEIEVMLYIRRQDEYLLSSWQQWYSKVFDDFWAWTTSCVGTLGDWRRYLQNWEELVPPSNITVRVFERARLDSGDVVVDFYNHLGVDLPFTELKHDKVMRNPGLSNAVVDLVKGNKLIFKSAHDLEFHAFVQELTGDAYMKDSRKSLITHAQRQAILGRYDESNRWVRDRYFNGSALFSQVRESDFDYDPVGMEREKLEFMISLLYQMRHRGGQAG